MARLYLAVLLGVVALSLVAVEGHGQDTDSAIVSAVLYPSGARVTRSAKLQVKEGQQTVKLKGVQPDFDENSLSVSGAGTAVVKILGAGIRSEFSTDLPDARARELEEKIQALNDKIAAVGAETDVLEGKKAFLDSIRLFAQGQIPKDLVTKLPSAEELKSTLTFLEGENKAYQDGRLSVALNLRDLTKQRDVLNQELAQLRTGGRRAVRVLAVDLECEKAGELTLELSYSVPQVSWAPVYDARVEFEKGKTVLSAFAVAAQTTGEDWTDVALTLSTARPSVSGRMPELGTWYLSPLVPMQRSRSAVYKAAGMMASLAPTSVETDGMSDKEDYQQNVPQRKAEMNYAQAESTGVSLVYRTSRPVTIKSDGSEARVPLLTQNFDAAFEYAATPKLSSYAYLTAKVVNGSQDQLMAGRVNIFLDGTFVGASTIERTVAPGESLLLYLGIDESVEIKRELIEEKADDTLIGSIPSPTRKIAYTYKFKLENKKARAITLKVFDHIPVAKDDKIRVTNVKAGLKPETDKFEDRPGVYCWIVTLQPKEKREFTLSYVIEYPRDLNVDGL